MINRRDSPTSFDIPRLSKNLQLLPFADDLPPLQHYAAVRPLPQRHPPEEQRARDVENLAVELGQRAAELQVLRALLFLAMSEGDGGGGAGVMSSLITRGGVWHTFILSDARSLGSAPKSEASSSRNCE